MKNNLELIVDEPIPGHYYWTIIVSGQPGDTPTVVDYARGPLPTYNSATASGVAALRSHEAAEVAAAHTHTGLMLSGMRAEWGVETMPAQLP
ncbi:hypothetical protein [Variovorax sp. PBL-E5]|uniref:hypothetical protein n=1 Tax=Variovorax sp. PBL-E5 TaxID=434014 RepID=UPI001317C747|nr:hypothetical protein [Variovorax sp. PBL-E5]VTU19255.1 hypothetical protein E5CHR_00750 [Variovorax sp. PBL-E5]